MSGTRRKFLIRQLSLQFWLIGVHLGEETGWAGKELVIQVNLGHDISFLTCTLLHIVKVSSYLSVGTPAPFLSHTFNLALCLLFTVYSQPESALSLAYVVEGYTSLGPICVWSFIYGGDCFRLYCMNPKDLLVFVVMLLLELRVILRYG